jgi:sulfate transport system permease protein
VIPGFGLTLGYTVLYLSLIVLIPLSALFIKTAAAHTSHLTQTGSPTAAIVFAGPRETSRDVAVPAIGQLSAR